MSLLQNQNIKEITYTFTECLYCGKPVKNSKHKRGVKRLYCDNNNACKALHHSHIKMRMLADKALDKLLEDNKGMSLEQFLPLLSDRLLINVADHLGIEFNIKDRKK